MLDSKRRILSKGQEVILIFRSDVGFVQQSVIFKKYDSVILNGVKHQNPIFEQNGGLINGLECFWVLPSDIKSDHQIVLMQYDLIDLQLKASALGYLLGCEIPEKIKDKEITNMIANQKEFRSKLKNELGYDPLDYSWVEKELAISVLEKSWFKFMREKKGNLNDDWENTVKLFKEHAKMDISIEEAFDLSRKWKRYLIGAWNTIASQNTNIQDWKKAAKEFENFHRNIEQRMMEWTARHQNSFPLVKTKKPIHFRHGPYFNQCIERIPNLFTDATCYFLKENIILQVVSYDPQEKYIRLDFTPDVRDKIKPGMPLNNPGMPLKADYIIYILPTEIDSHLEFLSPLE